MTYLTGANCKDVGQPYPVDKNPYPPDEIETTFVQLYNCFILSNTMALKEISELMSAMAKELNPKTCKKKETSLMEGP